MSIINTNQAQRGIRMGTLLVRQYSADGTQHADCGRMPRTRIERERASTVTDRGQQYLILDNCGSCTVDHVAINW
jgi:hypothetical protein